jgi:hypothetical protein
MDDERLKQMGGGGYWYELLNRIRDIRSCLFGKSESGAEKIGIIMQQNTTYKLINKITL